MSIQSPGGETSRRISEVSAQPRSGRAWLLAVLGLAAGFASSFLGIGGGLVIVPVLLLLFAFPIKKAVGTSLAAIVLVSVVGVVTEWTVKGSNIHWRMGLVLAVGSIFGSWAGGRILVRLPERPLRIAYAVFLAVAAYRMFVSSAANDHAGLLTVEESPFAASAIALGAGALAGLSSVLFGIGGGIVMVPALSLMFREFPFHAARATSLVTIVPTSAFGALQHWRMKTVDLPVATRLVPFGLVGAVLGVLTVNRLPAGPCRLVFALFLVVAAVRLLTMGGLKARTPQRPGTEPGR